MNGHRLLFTETDLKDYHKWTIKDAKDGDILSDNQPFIYNGKFDIDSVGGYCGLDVHDVFVVDKRVRKCWTKNINPAPKEQRDVLFKKMKEAGYEWDAENEKLCKL